jgi:hypothetical protein
VDSRLDEGSGGRVNHRGSPSEAQRRQRDDVMKNTREVQGIVGERGEP